MEICVKTNDNKLIKVFDTEYDKIKKINLTPVNNHQKNAEINFYIKDKKILTIHLNNLPPTKAKILDLPLILKLENNTNFNIEYSFNNKLESINTNLNKYKSKINIFKALLFTSGLLAISLLIFFSILFIPKLNNIISKNLTNKNVKINENKEITLTINENNKDIQKIQIEKKDEIINEKNFTFDSLNKVINNQTPLYFIKDKAYLLKNEDKKLNIIIDYLKNYNKVEILIKGYTNSINKPENELRLSKKRANHIKKTIETSINIEKIKLSSKGYGAKIQIIKNPSKKNEYMNRRVEIVIISAE